MCICLQPNSPKLEGLKRTEGKINGGILKLGQSYQIRLALTASFFTQPFQKYSTSNMMSRSP